MKTRVMVKEGEYRLSKSGVMDARIDAEELYCFMNNCDKVVLFLKKDEEVDRETERKYFDLINMRASRIPLQHITGVQEFMGFQFKVSEDVLIPRQDTETLVTEAAQVLRKTRKEAGAAKGRNIFDKLTGGAKAEILDLCCGSGAVGISLAKICGDVSVTGTDISEKALILAAENARNLRAEVTFIQGDMFEALDSGKRISGKGKKPGSKVKAFDMIVSNPPYIKTNSIAMLQEEVKKHDPLQALDGGIDGLDFYRIIVNEAADRLKPAGWLLLEIGHDQGEDLRKLIRDDGRYTAAEIVRDLPGKERVVKCRRA